MARRTKLVATLGPATDDPAVLAAVLAAGLDIARINFSHGDRESHLTRVAAVRSAAMKLGRTVAILADLPGPKLRVRIAEPRPLAVGDTLYFPLPGANPRDGDIPITEPEVLADVRPGDRMLLDDGRLRLEAGSVTDNRLSATVAVGGALLPNKGLNLPDSPLTIAAVTDRDRAALKVAAEAGVDWVALSFVRDASAADALREAVAASGMARVPVLAKLERPEAVERAGAIIDAFDGVMVARGDLGVEIPLEQVPTVQKRVIAMARLAGKPVITATEMLDSMQTKPRPTRAEVSDVANAIMDGTDAVMLSGETAVGQYPVESVACMARIAEEAENYLAGQRPGFLSQSRPEPGDTIEDALSLAACNLASEVHAAAIITPTLSGRTARLLARYRPSASIIAPAPTAAVERQLALVWGVRPVPMLPIGPGDGRMVASVKSAFAAGAVLVGDRVVVLAGHPVEGDMRMPTLRVVRVGEGARLDLANSRGSANQRGSARHPPRGARKLLAPRAQVLWERANSRNTAAAAEPSETPPPAASPPGLTPRAPVIPRAERPRMSHPPAFRLGCEQLETRDVPAALLFESFESASPPPGTASWGFGGFATSTAAAADGTRGLESAGPADADARFFTTAAYPANSPVSAKFRSDAVAPLELLARGSDLSRHTGGYLAATLAAGGKQVTLTEVAGDSRRTIATVSIGGGDIKTWLTITLAPVGSRAGVRVQRGDTGEYLSPNGTWQAGAAEALAGPVTAPARDGSVGIARRPGGAGAAYADSLTVAAPQTVESFDATSAGSLPKGWAGYSDGSGFAAAPGRAVSQPNGLASSGNSRAAARAWPDAPLSADQQATVSSLANSLIPAGVFVRGQSPGQAASSYYAVTVVRGVEVQLASVVNGVETRLGTVKSRGYLSGTWLDVTAVAAGSSISAQVRRLDTGAYLDADGTWRDGARSALSLTDAAIPFSGYAGVIRAAKYAGAVSLDDFRSSSAGSATQVAVDAKLSQPADAVKGELTVTATATPASEINRVEFRLDGQLRFTAPANPAAWSFDTDSLAAGSHTVEIRAFTSSGDSSAQTLDFAVTRAPQSAPSSGVPRHYSHIRVAALAYAATPFGGFEAARLGDSVDLVVANPRFAGAINSAAPATPQLVYSNISNLYQGLLSGWLGTAARTGADRELAFYHAAEATPFTGASPSSQPVTWFWAVSRDGTDLTPESRGGRPNGVAFAGNNGSVTVAHVDRFREVNVTLDKPAAAGWKGVWEYATAVDAAGNPTAWKSLALLSDGTASFSQTGQVTFDPPKDWAGGATYAVRVRTLSGDASQAPVSRALLGRDYVNANGKSAGTIPAFDAGADADRDGYLSDAEYANRRSGFDARFVSETRLFYPFYGQMRFAVNPSSAAVRAWAGEVHAELLTDNPLAGGIFLDNSNGRLPIAGLKTTESTAGYSQDYAGLVAAIGKATPGKFLLANTAGGRADSNPIAAVVDGTFEEFALRPIDATWAAVNDLIDLIKGRVESGPAGSIAVIDSLPGPLPVGSDRVRESTLAYYYIVGDPERTALMQSGGFTPSAAWRDAWIDSLSVDVGQPQGAATVFASGIDPTNAALTYRVFRRDYGNAISVYKPRSYATGKAAGTIDDATATTHDLGGRYQVLRADGTRGPVVTSVSLRNGEGVVLMRA